MTRGIIAAVSPEGIIGVDGELPWHYTADLERFKRLTTGTTVVMGRSTWESLPRRPLPHRRNIVITSCSLPEVECFPSLEAALATCEGDVWFIGGARIFTAAMAYADLIDLTYVPDRIAAGAGRVVSFPAIDATIWRAGPLLPHEGDPRLARRIYKKNEGETD